MAGRAALLEVVADYSAREAHRPPRTASVSSEEILDLAESALIFTKSAYWERMLLTMQTMEKIELDVLLNPKEDEAHSIARAAVAVCRRVQAMPYIDIEQGRAAMKTIESYSSKVHLFKAR